MNFSYLTGEVGKLGIVKIKRRIVSFNNIAIYDPFIGANGTNINGRTPPIAPVGASWSIPLGAAATQNNRAYFTNPPGAGTHANIDSGIANVSVSGIFNLGGNIVGIGPVARWQDTSHFWIAYFRRALVGQRDIRLIEVNGSSVIRGAYSDDSLSAIIDYTIELRASGTALSVLLNGAQIIAPYTSSYLQSVTRHGIYADTNNAGQTADDFTVTPL